MRHLLPNLRVLAGRVLFLPTLQSLHLFSPGPATCGLGPVREGTATEENMFIAMAARLREHGEGCIPCSVAAVSAALACLGTCLCLQRGSPVSR